MIPPQLPRIIRATRAHTNTAAAPTPSNFLPNLPPTATTAMDLLPPQNGLLDLSLNSLFETVQAHALQADLLAYESFL